MPEAEFQVKVVGVDYVCDDCGKGIMALTGKFNPRDGLWEHCCTICSGLKEFPVKYPTIKYERVSNEN